MHPILFQIAQFKLHAYGALMGAGFLIAMQLILKRGLVLGFSEKQLNNVMLLTFGSGILGARLLFILIDAPMDYLRDPLEILKIWKGGLVFFGGFILATTAMAWYAARHRLGVWRLFDLCTPALILAHAMGRLGCFMAGCCYGKVCDLPWAVTFRDPAGVGLKNVPLHPTQLYEALFLIVLYFAILQLRKVQRFPGMLFLVYLGLYSIGRSVIEFYRNDLRGGWEGLSTAQWISVPMLLLVSWLLIAKWRRITPKSLTS